MTPEFAAFEPVHAIARDPNFWSDFLFLTHSDRDYSSISNYDHVVPPDDLHKTSGFTLKCCRLSFPVTYERRLIFDLNCSLDYFSFSLLQNDGKRVELGWDDEAHWHPHVLRWDELELICKCLSIRDTAFAHPGLSLLLLCRWAPITDDDNTEHVSQLLRQACDRVGVDSPDMWQTIFARLDKRGNGFEWKYDSGHGWTLHQDNPLRPKEGFRYRAHLYSLRKSDNDAFPFAELNAMLTSAAEVCGKQ